MEGYYVVGVIAIPYLGFRVIINIVSREDNSYCVVIGDIPNLHAPTYENVFLCFGKEGNWGLIQTSILCV